jgi:hypothetical protein
MFRIDSYLVRNLELLRNIYKFIRHYMSGVVEFTNEISFFSLSNFPFPPFFRRKGKYLTIYETREGF